MRSLLAMVVVAVLGSAACTRNLQPGPPPCPAPHAQGAPNGIGIIGMSLDQRPNRNGDPELIVDRVVPDGPAAAAGIGPGDRIVSIEGASTRGMTIADAARRLRGPTAAAVALQIATGDRVRDVNILRVAPSDLWNGAAAARKTADESERVRASDVAPAAKMTAPPCRR